MFEFSTTYYTNITSNIVLSNIVITNEIIDIYFLNLKETVPYHVYENNPCIKFLFEVEGIKLGLTNYIIKILTDDCYIKTATNTGLSLMEKDYAIIPETDDTLDDRRMILLAKKRMRSICTEENLKALCYSYGYTSVDIIQHYAQYIVDIILNSETGFTKDINRLSKDVSVFIPAHLEIHWKLRAITKSNLKIASYNKQGEINRVYPFIVDNILTQGIFHVFASSYKGLEKMIVYPRSMKDFDGNIVVNEKGKYIIDENERFVIE